ncbi:carbohydrate ABC transporter permease [Clavibacter michiganensis]|uniref:carbohydrate ABC transporter permease n=1 Tax=Clavibacter michiganensis TaxID=28447 RepID=UPI0009CDD249|nr:sugar ABC transporter permease [Clavibacter michiganensis]MBF4639267.1 sugar ABC transporter permease [Clavibacter michiganensis subsp. michiganensis]MWJ06002.1 sugar ABC transporter permease [Clavibacter michiganensis subsp. michiganensis]MWJ18968.1 sugar ABC transporter permease [Clavibacter michiganensis subsp. michiganensis]MWJ48699.1 sugar ABC transporter permease [Clavibacter michiganensis subsp. michiganensis]MWJ88923.1 sugar ABC transporter permease [Clavibacter michiganensis subsp.
MAITATRAAGTRPGRTRSPLVARQRRRQAIVAWGFCLPFVAVFAVFMLVPLVSSFAMSFTDFRATDIRSPFAVDFTGLDQYAKLFTDATFLRSIGVTAFFVVVGIPVTMVIALALALALNSGRGRIVSFFRVGFYAPVVTSIVAVSVVWRYILLPDGLLNSALAVVGITGPNWLSDTTWALPSLVVMAVWRNVGTLMIIFLAGLQAVPEEVQEAAVMDGASPWRRLISVTLPLLRPTLLLGSVLISVGFLQFFEEAFVMTRGGPLDSTLSVAYYTYRQFGFGEYGLASAASYVLFLAIALLSLLQFRLLRSKD